MSSSNTPQAPVPGVAPTLLRRLWLSLCLVMAGGLWGLSPSLARFAIEDGASPLGLTLWQGVAGGLLLLSVSFARGRRPPASAHHLRFYLLCGLLGTALPTWLFFSVSRHIPAGVTAVMIAAVPLMTYAIALPLGLERLSRIRLTGIALGFAAVVLLVAPDGAAGVATPAGWVLLALLLPACYSAENIVLATYRPAGDDIVLVSGMLLASSALIAPLVFATGSGVDMTPPWSRAQWATGALVLVNVVSYTFFLYLVKTAGPVFAAQAGYLSMLFGVAAGSVLLGETHSSWFWVALALMLTGMALVRERVAKPNPAPPLREAA